MRIDRSLQPQLARTLAETSRIFATADEIMPPSSIGSPPPGGVIMPASVSMTSEACDGSSPRSLNASSTGKKTSSRTFCRCGALLV